MSLAPLEAVSRKQWDGDPTWFKRLLEPDDLTLLQDPRRRSTGRPTAPTSTGTSRGSPASGPTTDLWLTLHHVVDADKNEVEPFTDPAALRVLHYESFSGEDFVRKWTSILAAGPKPNFRPAASPPPSRCRR